MPSAGDRRRLPLLFCRTLPLGQCPHSQQPFGSPAYTPSSNCRNASRMSAAAITSQRETVAASHLGENSQDGPREPSVVYQVWLSNASSDCLFGSRSAPSRGERTAGDMRKVLPGQASSVHCVDFALQAVRKDR